MNGVFCGWGLFPPSSLPTQCSQSHMFRFLRANSNFRLCTRTLFSKCLQELHMAQSCKGTVKQNQTPKLGYRKHAYAERKQGQNSTLLIFHRAEVLKRKHVYWDQRTKDRKITQIQIHWSKISHSCGSVCTLQSTLHLKGQFTQKWKFCHHLLTLMSFQTCMI